MILHRCLSHRPVIVPISRATNDSASQYYRGADSGCSKCTLQPPFLRLHLLSKSGSQVPSASPSVRARSALLSLMGQRCGGNSILIVWMHSASCTRLISCAMGYVVATMLLLHAYLCCDSACLRLAARMLHVCI